MDVRIQKLADTIVNYSLKVKSGDNVVIDASDFSSIELVKEIYRLSLQKGANAYVDIFGTNFQIGRADFGGLYEIFLNNASEKVLDTIPEIMEKKIEWGDKFARICSVHNRNFLSSVDSKKISKWRSTYYDVFEKMINKDWLLTYWPTIGTAQNAEMSLEKFTDFYFDACNIDYVEQGKSIKVLSDILDRSDAIHISGNGIDIQLGIKDRLFAGATSGTHNIPDGECFTGPEEDKTEGFIEFEYPQIIDGNEVTGIRLEFEKGKIVNYSAKQNQKFLDEVLNDNEGNRRLGELGIGFNKGITKYIKDILFDEKIYGTVHFALGKSYDDKRGGGKNKGSIHWDMIKDLRHKGSIIKADDKVIFKDGEFLI